MRPFSFRPSVVSDVEGHRPIDDVRDLPLRYADRLPPNAPAPRPAPPPSSSCSPALRLFDLNRFHGVVFVSVPRNSPSRQLRPPFPFLFLSIPVDMQCSSWPLSPSQGVGGGGRGPPRSRNAGLSSRPSSPKTTTTHTHTLTHTKQTNKQTNKPVRCEATMVHVL